MIYIFVNIGGLILIALVVWWFWIKKSKPSIRATQKPIDILVENDMYTPAVIQANVGSKITLRFLRKDEQPCAATVVFGDFNISAELPLEKPVDVTIHLDRTGEFEFTCQMGMYRGMLIVK